MSNGGSMADRNNERNNVSSGVASQADSDYAADPASSTFFASDLKKYGDLKNMLESSKDQLRLEAMKRIIGMVAKGKDASELFPSVVKNVVSKNIEIKKLVYAYLIRYAEEQQDLALLSISTFQRALKDPNQLIRANALRVLSSIRVPVIVPIMMLAIRDSTNDMSPYVRKSAALAIPKLYSLDDEQKDQLVEVLEKLLGDRTTLVIGSAVMAFEEVCPERIDLIHKNYRRLCQILMDLEEWGQVAVLNMLTRYARTQFADPNEKEAEEDGDEEFYEEDHSRPKKLTMDSDLRLLLRSAKPLLQSRNSAVVMAVIQLYFHVAPKAEMVSNIKPMIRLLRSHREIQSVVLSNIATLAAKPSRRFLFVPHLKTFFVRSSDPTHIKLQKLEILTSLASATTISIILREFQAYISTSDRELIACTIQAIGRCAMTIAEVTETCLNGLVALLSNRDDNVVGESVCVIRKLLQLQPTAHKDILRHLAKLIGTVTVPMAKASILWLIGEYCEQVPHIAPDVLRQVAKTFPKEENIVKLQVLTLAAKLFTVNPQQTSLLAVYVFNLAKYDINYDIRDRGRFLRALILPGGHTGEGDGGSGGEFDLFSKAAREILLATKPAPVMESRFKERAELQLGTLSHYLNTRTAGYQDLPAFPAVSLPSNVRDVELPAVDIAKKITPGKTRPSQPKAEAKFYSDGETEEDEEEEEEEEDDSSEEDSVEESDDDDEESDEDEEESVKKPAAVGNGEVKASGAVKTPKAVENGSDDTSDESESDDEDDSDEEDSSEEDVEEKGKKPAVKPQVVKPPVKAAVPVVRDIGSPKTDSAGSSPRTAAASSKTAPAPQPSKTALGKEVAPPKPDKVKGKSQNIDMLLDFDSEIASSTASIMPTTAPLFPLGSPIHSANKLPGGGGAPTAMPPVRVPNRSFPLLAGGLNGGFAIAYKFPRRPFIYSAKMVAIELTFTNSTDASLENIKIVRKKLPPRVEVQDFHEIAVLEANRTAHGTVGVDCGDTTQSIGLTVECSGKQYDVTFKPRLCEMLRPIAWNKEEFEKARKNLSGLNENYSNVELPVKLQVKSAVVDVILDAANVAPVANGDDVDDSGFVVRFIGQTVSSSSNVLISVAVRAAGKAIVTVNCEKVMVGSVVLQELREAFSKA